MIVIVTQLYMQLFRGADFVNLKHTMACLFVAAQPTQKDETLCAGSEILLSWRL